MSVPINQPATVQQFDPSQAMASTMAMMKTMMEIFAPVLHPPVQQQVMPDFSGVLLSNFQNMNEMMRGQALEMAKLIRDVQRGVMMPEDEEIDDPDSEDNPEEQGILQMIMPLLSEYIPKLLGGGPESKAITTVVRAAPQFKRIINDVGAVTQLVRHLDQTQGKEKTDAILAKLKVTRPGVRKK
jgi:hypothetical protein